VTEDASNLRLPRILSRYVIEEFVRILGLCMAAFVLIYLIVDFFDRFDDFLKHKAAVGAAIRYFLFKIPLVMTQVLPVAVLAAMLMALGTLRRNNEIAAMRACGISSYQIAAPLLLACLALSVASLVWNETVVPHFTRQVRYINTIEIKKREFRAILGEREIWAHGTDAFYNIESFDSRNQVLGGVTVYNIDKEFGVKSVTEVGKARWVDDRWVYRRSLVRRFSPDGQIETKQTGSGVLDLKETPADLTVAQREAEEFNYFDLRDLIENLRRKGLDATEYRVDLRLKLALPFISLVMALIAIPLGIQKTRSVSLATSIATGLVIGFSYWVVLGLAVSLGHSGALPPMLAAWIPNAVFGGLGLFLLLGVA
jgi:lipopolysaccharide export system permease protein